MKNSLKGQNMPKVATGLLLNLLAFWGAFPPLRIDIETGYWPVDNSPIRWAAGGLAFALAGVLGSLLSAECKARLVFLRWKNPLPGSRAFSQANLTADTRINLENLRKRRGPFPRSPAKQNAKWYSIFKRYEDEPSVAGAHRRFLLYRDLSTAVALLGVPLIVAAFMLGSGPLVPSIAAVVLACEVFVLATAARNEAKRLVSTVLAIDSAQPPA